MAGAIALLVRWLGRCSTTAPYHEWPTSAASTRNPFTGMNSTTMSQRGHPARQNCLTYLITRDMEPGISIDLDGYHSPGVVAVLDRHKLCGVLDHYLCSARTLHGEPRLGTVMEQETVWHHGRGGRWWRLGGGGGLRVVTGGCC
jgi:hypothetical protein